MIDRFLGDAFGVLSFPFWSTVVQCGALLPIHTADRVVNGARFLTVGVFECDIAHCRSVAMLCMLYKIRCNPVHLLNCALYLDRMCQRGLHAVLWSYIGSLTRFLVAEPRSTAEPLFPFLCPSGTILLALYLIVWDWRVSYVYYFSRSLISVYWLLLWAGVFGVIGCISLSLSLTLPTFF